MRPFLNYSSVVDDDYFVAQLYCIDNETGLGFMNLDYAFDNALFQDLEVYYPNVNAIRRLSEMRP